ncbi:hypothetical protein VTJ49DRAFT_3073 [Mycothermus thermophilus]|uniref:Uncharacterized protein n=1 Tax=Humicola insolens TaxID=85995 RepID=A0ABR3V9M1_HUMIN
MTSLSRSLAPLIRARPATTSPSLCAQCRRSFGSSPVLPAGHNKWSKIRHDKAANDRKKAQTRNPLLKSLTLYSKLYGPDPKDNPQLATVIAACKKVSVPKEKIEAAIARGQGKSSDGATLEQLTLEAVVPPSIALIIEVETESKGRVLQDVNHWIRKVHGSVGASKFFFTRRGRVVLVPGDTGLGVDEIMDEAIEAGAEDLENDADGNIVVWTQPTDTMRVAKSLASKFGLKISSSDIMWTANEDTKATLDASHELNIFIELLEGLRQDNDVQAIYSNVSRGSMSDEQWERIQANLDG